ncbi:MAG: thiosulfate oxidation carrier complex protein SoxZ [Methylophilaceae bacterium]
MKRRKFLGFGFATALLVPLKAFAAVWNKAAFEASSLANAEKGLSVADETPSQDIEITAPNHAENGAIVQVAVHSRIPNTEAIAIFVDKNPTALIGNYMFSNGALPNMVTRIKMAETSDIKVIVKSGNQYFTASKKVTVLENGCGGTSSVNEQFKSSMKIRAKQLKNSNTVQVKAIITHPMHTGAGKDGSGQLIPAHFIQLITIKHHNQPTIDMQLGTGISKNPYLTFHLSGAKLGDTIAVEWHDNFGNSDRAETKVIA